MVDTGHGGMWMGGFFDLTSPRQSYIRSAGHLGWAFSAGLGAKCACPDRPVITFTGDAGFWYHIAEIETAVRWKMNAVTVVNNNASGNQSKRGFDRVYGGTQTEKARELWTYNPMNFARLAEDMGAIGIRVEKPNEIGPAINAGLESRPAGRNRRGDRHRCAGTARGHLTPSAKRLPFPAGALLRVRTSEMFQALRRRPEHSVARSPEQEVARAQAAHLDVDHGDGRVSVDRDNGMATDLLHVRLDIGEAVEHVLVEHDMITGAETLD